MSKIAATTTSGRSEVARYVPKNTDTASTTTSALRGGSRLRYPFATLSASCDRSMLFVEGFIEDVCCRIIISVEHFFVAYVLTPFGVNRYFSSQLHRISTKPVGCMERLARPCSQQVVIPTKCIEGAVSKHAYRLCDGNRVTLNAHRHHLLALVCSQ